MKFSYPIPQYCERGTEAALWAEPFNAVSNIGFFLAAIVGAMMLIRRPAGQKSWWHYLLVLLACLIGIGSSLFHIFANWWSILTDIVPIYLFMFSFLIFSLARLVQLPLWQTVFWTVLFVLACYGAPMINCSENFFGLLPIAMGSDPGGRCLNGSLNYVPALIAMLAIGMILKIQSHPVAHLMLAAGVIFFISLVFRTADWDICSWFVIFGQKLGSHWLWHVLNSVVLVLLLQAAIEGFPKRETLPRASGTQA